MINSGTAVTDGNVSDAQIASQISVLNAAFASQGWSFNLVSTDRTTQPGWFAMGIGSAAEAQATDGGLDVLHLFVEPKRGVGYLSFTPWLSPWGGHETSPWHYLGGRRAAKRYRRKHGVDPKNEYGVSLHSVRAGEVIDWFRARADLEVYEVREVERTSLDEPATASQ